MTFLAAGPVSLGSSRLVRSRGTVASEQTGIFYPLVKRVTYVEAGMKVGYVTDYLGRVIFETRAPVAGVVLYVCAVPSMTKGAAIANIGCRALRALVSSSGTLTQSPIQCASGQT